MILVRSDATRGIVVEDPTFMALEWTLKMQSLARSSTKMKSLDGFAVALRAGFLTGDPAAISRARTTLGSEIVESCKTLKTGSDATREKASWNCVVASTRPWEMISWIPTGCWAACSRITAARSHSPCRARLWAISRWISPFCFSKETHSLEIDEADSPEVDLAAAALPPLVGVFACVGVFARVGVLDRVGVFERVGVLDRFVGFSSSISIGSSLDTVSVEQAGGFKKPTGWPHSAALHRLLSTCP